MSCTIQKCTGNRPVLNVYNSNVEGKLLHTDSLGSIAAGGSVAYTYQIPDNLLFVDDPETMNALYCEVVSDAEERELANNGDRIVFDNLLPLKVSIAVEADYVKFTVSVKNEWNDDLSNSMLVLALYGKEKEALTVQTHTLSITAGGSATAEFSINRNRGSNAAQAKVFWLSNQHVPITRAWEGVFPTES